MGKRSIGKLNERKVDVLDFVAEFVRRLRKSREVPPLKKPSLRVGTTICKILVIRLLRKGKIDIEDLIEVAVRSVHPSLREIARKIAEEILKNLILGEELSEETEKHLRKKTEKIRIEEEIRKTLSPAIQKILREVSLAKQVEKMKKKGILDYYKDVKMNISNPLYQAAKEILENLNEILWRGINNDDELKEYVSRRIRQQYGNLTPQKVKAALKAGFHEDLKDSPYLHERLPALSEEEVKKELEKAMKENMFMVAKALNFLKSCDADITQHLERLAQKIEDLNQFSMVKKELPEISNIIARNSQKMREIARNSVKKIPLSSAFKSSKGIPQLQNEVLDAYEESSDYKPSLEDILSTTYRESLFNRMLKNIRETAKKSPNPATTLIKNAIKMRNSSKSAYDTRTTQELMKSAAKLTNESLDYVNSKLLFKQIVKNIQDAKLPLNLKRTFERGKSLGMSDLEIYELINPSYKVLKQMIKEGIKNYQRFADAMKNISLSSYEYSSLFEMAYKSGNMGALAALGEKDLKQFARNASRLPSNERDKAIASLSAGSGLGLLKQWFESRDEIENPEIKEKIRNIAKKVFIDLGIEYAHSKLGSSPEGILPSITVRPFIEGDDADLIDVEATISNILSKGKNPLKDYISPDDIMVRDTEKGRRAVVFLHDISGSMSGEKLSMTGLAHAMLIYALRKDEIATALFESNTHIVKDLEKELDIEKLADTILDLKARGGTRVIPALKWSYETFEKTNAREKYLLVFSDSAFFENERKVVEELRKISGQDVKIFFFLPRKDYTERFIKVAKEQGVPVRSIIFKKYDEIPDLITETLRKT